MYLKHLLPCLFFLAAYLPICAQQAGFAPSNGVSIAYKVWGKGTPILVINGGPGGNSEGFAYIAGLLSEKYQAITFDQRGTGKSVLAQTDSTTITMDLMVEDIEALRKHLHIAQWVVMGQSFGGMLGAYYTARYPQYVKGIIFSASGGLDLAFMRFAQQRIAANLTQQENEDLSYWGNRLSQGDTTFEARKKRALALAPAYVVNKKHVPVIAERLMQVDMHVNAIVFGDLQRIKFDCKEKLRTFKAPVLILQGKQDIIAPEIAETTRKTLPQARLVMLDNCSHYGWLDQKETYMREIHTFMKKI